MPFVIKLRTPGPEVVITQYLIKLRNNNHI
jgi:hypothetical protein